MRKQIKLISMMIMLMMVGLLAGCMPKSVDCVSEGKYLHDSLDKKEQKVYDQVLHAIMNREENVKVSTTDVVLLDKIFDMVMAENGEIFWVEGYMYTQMVQFDRVFALEFTPTYTKTAEEVAQFRSQVDVSVQEMLANAPQDGDDYAKVKYAYETIINKADYNTQAEENQNIISVFLNGETVCQGYANAMQYLLDQLGVQSFVVKGNANAEAHAWNIVRIDGEYYYLDATWGNSTYSNDNQNGEKHINYSFMTMTDAELAHTHALDVKYQVPACTSKTNSYYVREGLYFDSWDAAAVGKIFADARNAGQAHVAVQFATPELAEQAKQYMIDQRRIRDYCPGLYSFYYMEEEGLCTLSISF